MNASQPCTATPPHHYDKRVRGQLSLPSIHRFNGETESHSYFKSCFAPPGANSSTLVSCTVFHVLFILFFPPRGWRDKVNCLSSRCLKRTPVLRKYHLSDIPSHYASRRRVTRTHVHILKRQEYITKASYCDAEKINLGPVITSKKKGQRGSFKLKCTNMAGEKK